jgi:filamentous hemagglutinin
MFPGVIEGPGGLPIIIYNANDSVYTYGSPANREAARRLEKFGIIVGRGVLDAITLRSLGKVFAEPTKPSKTASATPATTVSQSQSSTVGPGQDPDDQNGRDQQSRFGSERQLNDHFNRHGSDFGARTAAEYEAQASRFLSGPRSSRVLESVRTNGDIVRYDPVTEEFGVLRKDGTIRTYYKPDPSVHGYPSNLDYFMHQ